MVVLIWILFWVGTAGVARGQECTVWINASDGNDSNDGSQFAPVQSMERGFNLAADQGTVCVAAGEYFRGLDEDGILFASQSKSVTFDLRAFAGANEVRLSEEFLVSDPGGGTIRFTRQGAESLVIGAGLLNSDSIHPDNLNFLHSLEVRSGTLDFGTVPVSIESPTGNPQFVSTENSDKQAPSWAAIRIGGTLSGNALSWSGTPRQWIVEGGSDGSERVIRLPALASTDRLSLSAASNLRFPEAIRLGPEASMTVESGMTGTLLFDQPIEIEAGSSISDAGERDQTYAISASGTGVSNLTFSGSGRHILSSVSQSSSHILDIHSSLGDLILGFDGDLRGSVRAGRLEVTGDVSLTTDQAGFTVLDVSDAVSVGADALEISSEAPEAALVVLSTDVEWSGPPLRATGAITFSGGGTFPLAPVAPATLTANGVSLSNGLSVTNDIVMIVGALGFTAEGNFTMTGGSLILSPLGTFSATSAVLSGGRIEGNDGWLAARDLVQITEGDISDLGIRIQSDGPALFASSLPIGEFVSAGAPVTVTGMMVVEGGCDLESGTLRIGDESTLTCGTFSGGADLLIDLATGASLGTTTEMDLRQVRISAAASSSLLPGNALLLGNRDASLDQTQLVVGADPMTVRTSDSEVHLGTVAWPPSAGSLMIDGKLRISGPLEPGASTIHIQDDSVLRVDSDVILKAGSLAFSTTSTLALGGASNLSGADGQDLVLPSVSVLSGRVSINSNATISGVLSHFGGDLEFASGIRIDVAGAVTSSAGTVSLATGSTLSIGGGLNMSNQSTSLDDDATLVVSSGMQLDSDVIGSEQANLVASGSGAWRSGADMVWKTIEIGGSDHAISLQGESTWTATDRLELESNTSLDLGDATLTLGGNGTQELVLDGRITSSGSGTLRWVGAGGTWSGSGRLDRLTVDLESPSSGINFSGTVARIDSRLDLLSGNLRLGTGSLEFASEDPTEIRLRLDGDQFLGDIDSDSPAQVNPTSSTIDVSVSGQAGAFVQMGRITALGPIRNLILDTPDLFNDPPLFGLVHAEPISLAGTLSVTSNTRVDVPLISAGGISSTHTLAGVVKNVALSGTGTVNGGTTGSAERLTFEDATLEVVDLPLRGSISATNSTISLFPGDTLRVSNRLNLIDSSLRFSAPAVFTTDGDLFDFSLSNSTVEVDNNENLILTSPGSLEIDDASSWLLSNPSSDDDTGGFLVLEDNASLAALPGIPRLRLAGPGSTVTLGSNLRISDHLVTESGTLDMSGNELAIDGGTWTHASTTVRGGSAGSQGRLSLEGSTSVTLEESLSLDRIDLRLAGGGDTMRIQSATDIEAKLILPGGFLSASNGVLVLDGVDLVVTGVSETILQLETFRIASDMAYETPQLSDLFEAEADWYPFDDTRVAEVVLAGSAGAAVVSDAASAVSALRIEQSIQTATVSDMMTVENRFVFGGGNASLITQQDNQLQLGNGSFIIRRGGGILNHQPTPGDTMHLAYDLDQTLETTGVAAFTEDILSSGLEVPASAALGALIIQAGGTGADHTVRLTRDVAADDIVVWSGRLDWDQTTLSLAEAGRLVLLDQESMAPSILEGGSGSFTAGPQASFLSRISSATRSLGPELLSPAHRFDRFVIDAGSDTGVSSDIVLNGPIDADQLILSARTPSEINLFGNDLRAGNLTLTGVALRSDPVANILTSQVMSVQGGSSLTGNINVRSEGNATVSGSIDVLEWDAESNLSIQGDWASSSHLKLTGSDQLVIWGESEPVLDRLTLDTASPNAISTLSIPAGGQLRVVQSAVLNQGVLRLDNLGLTIDLGAQLTVADGSWFEGSLSRRIASGFTGSVSFPLGDSEARRALRLILIEPLIATSTFEGTLVSRAPLIETGLPWQGATTQAMDTAEYYWTVTSSVNFATSQSFSVSSPADENHASSVTLLTRTPGDPMSLWVGSDLSSSSTLQADLLERGLTPTGLLISPGLSARQSGRAWLQIALDDSSSASRGVLSSDGEWVLSTNAIDAGTVRMPVSVPESGDSGVLSLTLDASDETIAVQPELVPDRTTFVVMGGFDQGSSFMVASPSQAQGIVPFNAGPSGSELSLVEKWPTERTLATGLSGRTFAPSFTADFSSAFELRVAGAPAVPFVLDSSSQDAPRLLLLNPSGSARLLESDGRVITSVNATNTDADGVQAQPAEFTIRGPFPNPSVSGPVLLVEGRSDATVHFDVIDVLGRIVLSETMSLDQGQNRLDLSRENLTGGVYWVRIRQAGRTHSVPFIVTR